MGIHLNVTEWMRGHVGFGAKSYAAGEAQGIAENTTFVHEVLIEMTDIDGFVTEPKHAAPLSGYVWWLGEKREFSGGELNMLVASTDTRMMHMFYRIPFTSSDGKPMTMLGHKELTDDPGLDLPADITTLFIHIYDRDMPGLDFTRPDEPKPEWPPGDIARGILHLPIRDGINSALSFHAPGSDRVAKLAAVRKFLDFYGSNVYRLYLEQSDPKVNLLAAAIAMGVVLLASVAVMFVR